MLRVYISAKLADDSELCRVRDRLYERIDGLHYYQKSSPHITVVPPFFIEDDKEDQVSDLVDSLDLEGLEVNITGLSVWRNIHEPNYVMLNVETDIYSERQRALNELDDIGAHLMNKPVSPHITLFSRLDWVEHIPASVKKRIQNNVNTLQYPERTTIREVKLQVKE